MSNRRMNIATSLNSKYMKYTCVMLTSLLENQPKEADIHVYLLQSDLTKQDADSLTEVVQTYGGTLHLISINRDMFPASCPVSESWSLEAYYRLMLSDILPKEVDRLLYLDVDIIVNKSLEEMYFTDFEGCVLCACPDPFTGSFPDSRNEIFREQLRKGFIYFNSGVLLLNMELLREKYHFEDYMKVAEELDFKLEAPDQDLLNYVHWEEVKIIDANNYNLFARLAYNHDIHYEEVKEQVTIVHFPGHKPWSGKFVHYDIEQLWWDYAKKTAFYYEFMEAFLAETLHDPMVYDTLNRLSLEKAELKEELVKSASLCQKLLQLVQEK